jgi:DNA topoisomerase IA
LRALAFTGRIVDDAKVSDHHAIIPTGKRPGALAPAAQKVFDAVVTRLIAAFYPACVKEVTTVAGVSNGVPFRAKGVRVLEPGWTELYPRKTEDRRRTSRNCPRSATARVARTSRPSGRERPRRRSGTPRPACWGRWRRPAGWSTTRRSRRR